jgi:hypothetical protein
VSTINHVFNFGAKETLTTNASANLDNKQHDLGISNTSTQWVRTFYPSSYLNESVCAD